MAIFTGRKGPSAFTVCYIEPYFHKMPSARISCSESSVHSVRPAGIASPLELLPDIVCCARRHVLLLMAPLSQLECYHSNGQVGKSCNGICMDIVMEWTFLGVFNVHPLSKLQCTPFHRFQCQQACFMITSGLFIVQAGCRSRYTRRCGWSAIVLSFGKISPVGGLRGSTFKVPHKLYNRIASHLFLPEVFYLQWNFPLKIMRQVPRKATSSLWCGSLSRNALYTVLCTLRTQVLNLQP
ncbi:unnamed protein product [Ixodes pacificus]